MPCEMHPAFYRHHNIEQVVNGRYRITRLMLEPLSGSGKVLR